MTMIIQTQTISKSVVVQPNHELFVCLFHRNTPVTRKRRWFLILDKSAPA